MHPTSLNCWLPGGIDASASSLAFEIPGRESNAQLGVSPGGVELTVLVTLRHEHPSAFARDDFARYSPLDTNAKDHSSGTLPPDRHTRIILAKSRNSFHRDYTVRYRRLPPNIPIPSPGLLDFRMPP
jgi:hypothetical protein